MANQNFKIIISLIDIFFISISLLVIIVFGSLLVFGSTLKKDSFFSRKELTKIRISQPSFVLFIWCCIIALILKLNQTSYFESEYFYYNNQVHLTGLILIFFFIIFGIICYSFFKKNSQLSFEFVLLLFFLLLSMLILISSSDLFVWFLTLELQSFALYSLAGYRSNRSFIHSEGALKYFIFGSLASSFFIFGLSILYLNTATVNYEELLALSYFPQDFSFYVGIFFILVGLFFKLGIAPFHIWLPEVYYSVSHVVTFLFILIPKIPLLHILFIFSSFNHIGIFNKMYVICIFLSLFVGGFLAFNQTNYKKFMAFSSVFNNAFFLTALLLHSSFSYFSLMSYLISYQILLTIMFIPFLFLKRLDHTLILINLRDLVLLKKTSPLISLLFSFGLFSLAGIPPFFGFFPKFFLFLAVLDRNYFFILMLLIFFSVFSCYYYLRLIKIIFFAKKLFIIASQEIPKEIAILFMIFSVINLLFFFYPSIYFIAIYLLSL
jgi:NADH-quinone oxidoreductase subunit N